MLPSQGRDHMTRALDETYERGFLLGRAAGLERVCELLRVAGIGVDLIATLTKEKYQ